MGCGEGERGGGRGRGRGRGREEGKGRERGGEGVRLGEGGGDWCFFHTKMERVFEKTSITSQTTTTTTKNTRIYKLKVVAVGRQSLCPAPNNILSFFLFHKNKKRKKRKKNTQRNERKKSLFSLFLPNSCVFLPFFSPFFSFELFCRVTKLSTHLEL